MTATRASRTSRRQPRGSVADRHGDTAGLVQQSEPQARERSQALANGPVVVLTFSFAGGHRLNSRLQRVPELACTTGTGILGMCDMVARAWENVEDSDGERMSSLAARSIRAMVTTMMTVIVARSGARRWCETAAAEPAAAEAFLRIAPNTQFICLYRACPDVVRTVLRSSPWGIIGRQFTPYLQAQPANTAAAIAACWTDSVSQLLDFESRHPQSCLRVRYEDLLSNPDATSAGIFEFIGVTPESPARGLADEYELPDGETDAEAWPEFPAERIPPQLIQRINQLHEQLDYPQLSASA